MTPLTEAEASHVAAVFEAHSSFIESIARRHSVVPSAVPDIVQTVGMHVCRSLRGYRGASAISTWLYRITVNAARDHYRAEHRQQRAVEGLIARRPGEARWAGVSMATAEGLEGAAEAVIEVHRRERSSALRASLARLRPKHATALRDDLDGAPVIHSRQTRHRAVQELRGMLTADTTLAN